MKHVNLPLNEEQHKALKVHCAIEGRSMVSLIQQLVKEYLEKVNKSEKGERKVA